MCSDKGQKIFSWALYGSIFYELVALGHKSLLFYTISPIDYGYWASFLSFVHIMSHVVDAGASNTITPFLSHFLKSKRSFSRLLFYYTFIPHAIIVLVGIGGIIWWGAFQSPSFLIARFSVVMFVLFLIVETLNAFFRQFLYATGCARQLVIGENVLLIILISSIWIT